MVRWRFKLRPLASAQMWRRGARARSRARVTDGKGLSICGRSSSDTVQYWERCDAVSQAKVKTLMQIERGLVTGAGQLGTVQTGVPRRGRCWPRHSSAAAIEGGRMQREMGGVEWVRGAEGRAIRA